MEKSLYALVSVHLNFIRQARVLYKSRLILFRINGPSASITDQVNRDICLLVKKCVMQKMNSETFNNLFEYQHHQKNTRNNNNYSVKLPRIELEVAKARLLFCCRKLRKVVQLSDSLPDLPHIFIYTCSHTITTIDSIPIQLLIFLRQCLILEPEQSYE